MNRHRASLLLSLAVLLPAAGAFAAPTAPAVSTNEVRTMKATIEAIDWQSRMVTLKGQKGEEVTVHVPDSVKRFSNVKVGDVVTAKYMEGYVFNIKAPGESNVGTGNEVLTTRPGDLPGGTIARQLTGDVKIKAIDPKAPSVTVKTGDGRTVSFLVKDAKRIQNLKVGDVIRITYTEALVLNIDPQ